MRQASLKLKSYVGSVNVMDNRNLRHRLLFAILYSFGILAAFYIFILGSMVFNIIERKGFEKEALSLSNEVGNLELVYLSMSNKVDLNLSFSLGFEEVKPKFAIRKTLGFIAPLSLKLDNEI